MPRPTRRAAGLLLSAGLLLLIGTNVQAGWLFVMASGVVGLVVTGTILPIRTVGGIEVERLAPDLVSVGDQVRVGLRVRNATGRTRPSMVVEDDHVAPVALEVPPLPAHGAVTLWTTRRATRRGIVDGAPVRLWSAAPFGIAIVRRSVPASGRTVIAPAAEPIGYLPEVDSASKPLVAAGSRARKGPGQDFIGIREYQHGDTMRHVHWPSSARAGTLMVREFEHEVPRRLGILIDTWADTPPGDGPTILDLATSVAASLVVHAARDAHPVVLTAWQDDALRTLSDAGPEEALEWLAGLRAPEIARSGGERPTLARLLRPALHELGRLDALALIVPTWAGNRSETLAPLVGDLDDSDLQVLAFVIDAGIWPRGGGTTLDRTATERLSWDLAAMDAAVYRIDDRDDLSSALAGPSVA